MQNDTIAIPRTWLKRLLELRWSINGVNMEPGTIAKFAQLFGFIESAETILELVEKLPQSETK